MLKPVTTEEKLQFTLKLQAEKATEELLSEFYHSGYDGYVDIWPVLSNKKGKVVMEILAKKLSTAVTKPTNENAVRYHVAQGKGVKRLTPRQ